MKDVADALRGEVESAVPRLRQLTEHAAAAERAPGKWVRKEILGHLIDSAANNHQRFVRAQLENPFHGPTYEQQAWVNISGYVRRPWLELVDLWAAMNRHLAHIIESTPAGMLDVQCVIGRNEPASLEWVMRDYVRHLRHHLEQIFAE